MNDNDLQQFIKALGDFVKHSEVEELYHEGREVYQNHRDQAKMAIETEIEAKSASLEVTCDYFMEEFMLD